MPKIRITGTPEMKMGGSTKRVRITEVPQSKLIDNIRMNAGNVMQSGGYADKGATHKYGDQQVGHGYALDRFWSSPAGYPGSTSKVQPYAVTGRTLPEAKDGGDINAEKQEQVLGDFDQDGKQELMNVNGKPHTEGGKNINVPSNSFVYSDTKALKIKNAEILAMFGMAPKKGGYTPAEIAKKYDLNKFKKVIDDPNADENAKKTAQLMSDNYLAKLNKLAAVQEEMKKHMGLDHHDPNVVKTSKYGGMPEFQDGGKPSPTWGMEKDDRNYIPYDQSIASAQGYPIYNPQTTGAYQQWANTQGANLTIDDKMGANTMGWQNPNMYKKPSFTLSPSMDISDAERNAKDIQDQSYYNQPDYNQVPYAPTSGSPINTTEGQIARNKITGSDKKHIGMHGMMNPNFMGDVMNIVQMANLKKFQPYEAPIRTAMPSVVFADPTRAIAAQQEAARIGMEQDAGSANASAGRAMGLARQGQAGAQAADTISKYDEHNIGIANAANQEAIKLTNDQMAREAARLNDLNKGNFLADRDYQREMGRLQATYADRMQKQHDAAVKTAWLNKTSPYFNIGPTGYPEFKDENARIAYERMQQGLPDVTVADRIKSYTDKGWTVDDAIKAVELERGNTRLKHTDPVTHDVYTTTGKYGGRQMRYGGSHMTMPEMAPTYARNTERIPYYQAGGDFGTSLNIPMGPDIPTAIPMQDNTKYAMPFYTGSQGQDNVTLPDAPPMKMQSIKGTDIATMTNNPGNIIYKPTFGKLFGAVDSGIKQKDGKGTFAIFPDIATGFKAYQTQLFGDVDGIMSSRYYKPDTTVNEALKKWSNNGYDGSIYPEIKNKTLAQLTSAERLELNKRQIKHESGSMYNLLRQRGVFKKGGHVLEKFIK